MMAPTRAVVFVGIALAVPLAACKFLSRDDEGADAAPAPASAAPQPAASSSAPAPAASVPPLASGSASAQPVRRVVVKLPDGGTTTVDASVSPDGAIVLPPGFQLPTFPGFDAAAFKLPGFDAASLPPMPTLPSGFPRFPGAPGAPDGAK